MWIVPAGCSLFLFICVIINFALLAQLEDDPIFQHPSGLSNDMDVSTHTDGTNTTSASPGSLDAPTPNNPPPSNVIPSGIPRKLSLRALTGSTGFEPSTSATSLPVGVSTQGALYLYVGPPPLSKPFLMPKCASTRPIISLILSLAWLLLGTHFLRKSRRSERAREELEHEAYRETILERKRIREENPAGGNWGWFHFGKPAEKEAGGGGGVDAQGKGGIGLGRFAPAWMMGGDKDAAPTGFV